MRLENHESIDSPGLLVYPDRVERNIAKMIEIVGGPENVHRLRPHVKTHKMSRAIEMQVNAGIAHFKAATIAEVKMVASSGGSDVLLAYQPVGPNIDHLFDLTKQFPGTTFSALVDHPSVVEQLSHKWISASESLNVYIDVDCGMSRTGVPLGDKVSSLCEEIHQSTSLSLGGLHVYDGHIHDPSLDDRRKKAESIIDSVKAFAENHEIPNVIGGGSPTFGIWASETSWQCSPGTPIFWDFGYGADHAELPFDVAAELLTRVISKPGENLLCFDLGYKAVAAEMPLHNRVRFPDIPDAKFVGHSEEHLVVETPQAKDISVGDAFIAVPRHICPTVARYAYATVIRDGRPTSDRWDVTARDR